MSQNNMGQQNASGIANHHDFGAEDARTRTTMYNTIGHPLEPSSLAKSA